MKKESIQKRFGKLSRPVNRNFVRIAILVVMILCASILGQCLVNNVHNDKPDTLQFDQDWEYARADGIVEDVEGYALLLEGAGLLLYRILMGLSYAFVLILIVLIMCVSLLIAAEVPIWPLFLAISLYPIIVLAWGIRDTYTKRARI